MLESLINIPALGYNPLMEELIFLIIFALLLGFLTAGVILIKTGLKTSNARLIAGYIVLGISIISIILLVIFSWQYIIIPLLLIVPLIIIIVSVAFITYGVINITQSRRKEDGSENSKSKLVLGWTLNSIGTAILITLIVLFVLFTTGVISINLM